MKGNNEEHRDIIHRITPTKTASFCEQNLPSSYTETESLSDLLNRGRMMVQKSIATNIFNQNDEISESITMTSNQQQYYSKESKKDETDNVAILPPVPFLPVVPPSNISRSYLPSSLTRQYLRDFSITAASRNRMLNKSSKIVSFLPAPLSTEDSVDVKQGTLTSFCSTTPRNTILEEDISTLKRHHHQQYTPNKKRRFQRRNSKCPSMFHMLEQHNLWNDEDDKDCQPKLSQGLSSQQHQQRISPERVKGSSEKSPVSPWGKAA